MAKLTSYEIEMMEMKLKSLESQISRIRTHPGEIPVDGCGSNSCLISPATGMGTNGSCGCSKFTFHRAIDYYKRVAEFHKCSLDDLKHYRNMESVEEVLEI